MLVCSSRQLIVESIVMFDQASRSVSGLGSCCVTVWQGADAILRVHGRWIEATVVGTPWGHFCMHLPA